MQVLLAASPSTLAASLLKLALKTWIWDSGKVFYFPPAPRNAIRSDIVPRIDVINAFVYLASPSITSPRQKSSTALVLLSLSCEDAMEEECERKMKVEINAIEPHPYKFGRKELHKPCNELNLWMPCECALYVQLNAIAHQQSLIASVIYGRGYRSVKRLADPHRLAATAPNVH